MASARTTQTPIQTPGQARTTPDRSGKTGYPVLLNRAIALRALTCLGCSCFRQSDA